MLTGRFFGGGPPKGGTHRKHDGSAVAWSHSPTSVARKRSGDESSGCPSDGGLNPILNECNLDGRAA